MFKPLGILFILKLYAWVSIFTKIIYIWKSYFSKKHAVMFALKNSRLKTQPQVNFPVSYIKKNVTLNVHGHTHVWHFVAFVVRCLTCEM